MRVRIRRFGRLRSAGESGDSQVVIVAGGQCQLQRHAGVLPPAARVGGHLPGHILRRASAPKLPIEGRASFPLAPLSLAQAVTDPFIQVLEEARSLGPPEILLPAGEVLLQLLRQGGQAPAAAASRYLPDSLLHRLQRFGGYPALHLASRGHPEAVAQKLPVPRPVHRALLLVDSQSQPRVQPAQCLEHSLPGPLGTHVHLAVVGVPDETQSPLLQRLIPFVEQHVGQQR